MKAKTLEEVKEVFSGEPKDKFFHYHLGGFELDKPYEDKDAYISVKWLIDHLGIKLKQTTWGEVAQLIKDGKMWGWNQLQSQSFTYQYFLPHGYTEKPENPKPGHSGMDFKNLNDEYEPIGNHCDFTQVDYEYEGKKVDALNSSYYHSAKAHWLIDSIRKEGLWNPIQGKVTKGHDEKYRLAIHPGSVRSGVFEILDDPTLPMWIWDEFDVIDAPEYTLEQLIEDVKENDFVKKGHKNISFNYSNGYVEISCEASVQTNFRQSVYEFNRNVSKLCKGKPINIYVGYDSRHSDLAELCKKCLAHGVNYGFGGGDINGSMSKWRPEIKFLDISKIPEYTRDYANQSTEFTYSRFLIPYLENYEGFSIFLDDDILFEGSILPMFYFMNPDDAVACIQYDFDKYAETKFNGEKNVSYPKKLWSSLMIFNNGHEDCKKLTPEIVNTETGKYLHQFEWTDKISEIPEWFVYTEGHAYTDKIWRPLAVHYTRGGPWIEDMDTSEIQHLNIYEKLLNKHKN